MSTAWDTTVKCDWCLQSGHVWKDCPDWNNLHGLSLGDAQEMKWRSIDEVFLTPLPLNVHYREPKPESKWLGVVSLIVTVLVLVLARVWVTR